MSFESFPESQNIEPKKPSSAANNMFLAQAEQNNPSFESLKQRRYGLNQEIGILERKLKAGILQPKELGEVMSEMRTLTSLKDSLTSQIENHRDFKKPGFEDNFSGKDRRFNR